MTKPDVASMQQALATATLDYELPAELIATRPAEPRDAARLLVFRRSDASIEHASVRDLPQFLTPNDLMVFNTTSVAPARLIGQRSDTRGRVEGLFLGEVGPGHWRVMLRSNGKLRPGQMIEWFDQSGRPDTTAMTLIERDGEFWIAEPQSAEESRVILDRVGRTPLPPYIQRARGDASFADILDRVWYQTVYADPSQRESVAAPTAGLHFTLELLDRLAQCGVKRADVVLHIGPGTFKPIEAATLDAHPMHRERYAVAPEDLERIRVIKCAPRKPPAGTEPPRVMAVGTTTVRTLESLPNPLPVAADRSVTGETSLLIQPGYEFRLVDGLMTNFHLPRSTLLALVAAMVGLDRMKSIYAEAVQERYRFYSYGDAMLILP